jgi:uncharacterized protein involved in outer membrane biogenesis
MRRALIVLLGTLVLGVALLLGALQGLKTDTARRRIGVALSNALGQPVTLGRLSVTLLPTPALTAGAIRIGSADSAGQPAITAAALRVVPRLSSLIPGRGLTIAAAELDSLVITVRRDSAGRWLLPLPRRGPSDTARRAAIGLPELAFDHGAIRIYDERVREDGGAHLTTITDVAATVRAAEGRISASPLSGRLGATTVSGAMLMRPDGAVLELKSESLQPVDVPAFLALMGMSSHPRISIAGRAPFQMKVVAAPRFASYVVTGNASAERMRVGDLDLEQVRTPFRMDRKTLTLNPIAFTAYGGRERGTVTVDLHQRPPRYTVRSSLVNLDVRRALTATTNVKNVLHGQARVSGDLRGQGYGTTAVQKSLAGTVRFELTDGIIRGFPALASIGRALGATAQAGENTAFESLTGSATIGGGRARTRDLVIRSGELLLAGEGTIGFDRTLDLRMVATLSPALSARLGGHLGLLNRLADERGILSLPLRVRGTAGAPKISVDVRAVAKQEFPDLVRRGLLELFQRN